MQASCSSLKDRGCVMTYAGTTTERAQETLDVTLQELVRLGKGVTAEELERLADEAVEAVLEHLHHPSGKGTAA